MAKTSPELLTDILGVLVKVTNLLEGGKSAKKKTPETPTMKASKGIGIDMKAFSQDKKTNEKVRDTADAMKILSSAMAPLAMGILKFGLLPNSFKKSVIFFIHDLLAQASFRGKSATTSAIIIAETMNILGTALPKLAKGVFFFGLMSKMGLVNATAMGIGVLFTALAAASPLAALALPVAIVLGLIGVALMGVAEVLKSIALVILSFAASVVIMIGAIWLATKLFGVSPNEAMGIVVKSIIILAGGFALIGILSPLIILSGVAVASMGVGLGLLGVGLLLFMGSLALVNLMMGGQKKTDAALIGSFKSIALVAAVFAGIGLFSSLIIMGGIAITIMSIGMTTLAIGILALGTVSALVTKLFGLDMFDMLLGVAKGIGVLGLMFAGLGLIAIAIIPGTAALILMSVSLGLFALAVWGIAAVIKTIGGKDGVETVSSNIELLVGGVIGGVIKGFSKGLGTGTENSPAGFLSMLGQAGQVALNIVALIGAIAMIGSLSLSLILFAMAIKAFAIAGVIKTITGYDKEGKPIFGESIDVASIGNNIALTLGGFFQGLVVAFNDPNKLPDAMAVAKMTNILMGRSGLKILGIRIISGEPGLLDAISKFGEVLQLFAKLGQIPVYSVDANGNQVVSGYTTASKVATNIVSTLSTFFQAFKDNKTMLEGLNTESTGMLAQILLGSKASALWKFLGVSSDKPGILEPIMKFGEMIAQYANVSKGIPTAFDDKGNATAWTTPSQAAYNIVDLIKTFTTHLEANLLAGDGAKGIEEKSKKIAASLSSFSTVISQFDTLGKSAENINLLGDSIGKLATNVGLLVTNMGNLTSDKIANLEKISTSAGKHAETMSDGAKTYAKSSGATSAGAQGAGGENTGADWNSIGTKIATAVMAKLNGQFTFEFPDGKVAGNVTFGTKK